MKYFVNYVLHNAETDGYAYQKPTAFDDLDSAKKEFHNALSTYINYGKLDRVSVMLFDDYNNIYMKEYWEKPVPPEPVPPEPVPPINPDVIPNDEPEQEDTESSSDNQ